MRRRSLSVCVSYLWVWSVAAALGPGRRWWWSDQCTGWCWRVRSRDQEADCTTPQRSPLGGGGGGGGGESSIHRWEEVMDYKTHTEHLNYCFASAATELWISKGNHSVARPAHLHEWINQWFGGVGDSNDSKLNSLRSDPIECESVKRIPLCCQTINPDFWRFCLNKDKEIIPKKIAPQKTTSSELLKSLYTMLTSTNLYGWLSGNNIAANFSAF